MALARPSLYPHTIVRRRQLHRPTLHPNKSTLVLPSACVFPRSGSFGLRSRRRCPPWCSSHGATICSSQHGQQNKRNRETTLHREADSPGPPGPWPRFCCLTWAPHDMFQHFLDPAGIKRPLGLQPSFSITSAAQVMFVFSRRRTTQFFFSIKMQN